MMWKDYFNRHPVVLIATGPSLDSVPDPFLRKYKTMGVNSCFMRKGIYPDFYVRIGNNQLNTPEKREVIYPVIQASKASFIGRRYAHLFPFGNVYPLYSEYDERVYNLMDGHPKTVKFSKDPMKYVMVHATVTYVALQLLYYMGADPVLIVGLDHTYGGKDRHFYSDDALPMYDPETREENPEIAKRIAEEADRVYAMARSVFEADGRRILNLTEGSLARSIDFDSIRNW